MEYKDFLGMILPVHGNGSSQISPEEVNDIIADQKGVANGLATLNGSGFVPASQLPSYVDDVVEYAGVNNFPQPG